MAAPIKPSGGILTEKDLKKVKPIEAQPGNADDPEDFVGRSDVDENATRRLRNGNNLLLTDPRRMGKTYWMKHFCAVTAEYKTVYIDYEGVSSSEEFLTKTASSLKNATGLPQKVAETMRGIFENIKGIDVAGIKIQPGVLTRSPLELLTTIIKQLDASSDSDLPWLICMDEVPLAILNISKHESPEIAGVLLQTLRDLRVNTPNIRWIVGGSVGFHHVLHHANSTEGELNDLIDLPLGSLNPADAAELSCRLLASIAEKADEGTIDAMVSCSSGIAHYLHAIVDTVAGKSVDTTITPAKINQAFREYLEDPDRSRATKHHEQRIEQYYGKDADMAKKSLMLPQKKKHQSRNYCKHVTLKVVFVMCCIYCKETTTCYGRMMKSDGAMSHCA